MRFRLNRHAERVMGGHMEPTPALSPYYWLGYLMPLAFILFIWIATRKKD